jgi:MFS family permease
MTGEKTVFVGIWWVGLLSRRRDGGLSGSILPQLLLCLRTDRPRGLWPSQWHHQSTGLATATGFFFGFLGSLLCPPLFGYIVDQTGMYGYGWLFLTFCAAAILLLLSFFHEKKPL